MASEVSTCTVGKFLENYLPNHGIGFDAVVGDLKKQKMLVSRVSPLDQEPSSSPRRPPFTHTFKSFKTLFRSRTTNPTRVVKALQTIGNAIRKALGKTPDGEVNDRFVRVEDNVGLVSHGCLTPSADGALPPTEVVVPMTVVADNCDYASSNEAKVKLLSRATEIMNEDARRRFCYGVTCEGPEVTLWRFSRSIVVKSTPFDMTEQPELLVQLFIALFSAPLHDLGYDPLVTLLPDGNYIYQLPSSTPLYFKTIRPIWDVRPTSLSGRRTRIWEVEQVISPVQPTRIPGTPTRALKDVFLSSNARTEADIQDDLFADIAKLGQDSKWRSRPLLKDFSPADLDMLARTLEGDRFKNYFSCVIANHLGEDDQLASVTPPTSPPKRRCLFLYERVCTPLNNISTLGEAVNVLKQSLIPLRLMFCAGWVHRDVSPGNIFAFRATADAPWQVKLSDLEHAKRFPDPGSSDGDRTTGTPYFIAYEVLDSQHLYPTEVDPDRIDPEGLVPPFPTAPVVHNYQHDLESIWWILLWLTTMRINQNLPRQFGRLHFQQRVDQIYARTRALLLINPLSHEPKVKESLPPALHGSFYKRLNILRHNLYAVYLNRNKEGRFNEMETFSWIISEGMRTFFDGVEGCRDQWGGIELIVDTDVRQMEAGNKVDNHVQVTLRPAQPPTVQRPKKRQNVELGEESRAPKRLRPMRGACDPQRSGPTTRSMTRNAGRMTRSATRRLREAKLQKQRR
ncbi:other/FunK1 protein kinase [Coprinopsis cinerea okayama7|uniref:Other/FunK1 protein kinase n=1 Tax=Coprinopsis cinerea (strain Okayama-7 / 130 / ATCC MYA-4618 / FGSC 9003) TaxID=240176 RepID=A8NAV9_COPC7|nr:other/FunK1 protein kinase [Coprinopsis cinerea okayama7\|eukprot:XP_001831961.1 other/FunK1 protein kinase [Coprinopsis cinerea okayama7\